MNQTETSTRSESSVETAAGSGREYGSKVVPYLERAVESGGVTAVVGGTAILGGVRALRGGERKRGLARLVFGAAFLAATVAQRWSRVGGGESDVEETDVVDTGPDVGAIADQAGGVGEEAHSADEAAAAVGGTSPDLEGAESGLRSESDTDGASASIDQREVADSGVDSEDLSETTERGTGDVGNVRDTETGDVDRLGEAAFDRQSREVPAPQRAFNQGFLAHSTETFWGIRMSDDAVLVSLDYDAVEGRDGVEYVASSEIGDDVRELPIPDAVLDHWDEVLAGGTAVTGGDGILFVTTDDLAIDGLLRVLPAEWADDEFGEEE